jgi:hypothetical protein
LAFSYWTIKPWFLTEGKTCCYIHHTFLLGFPNWPVIYFIITAPSIAITPAAELQPITLAWLFVQWGLDMVGKLHKSWRGGHIYLLVAVDKFTKWIEAAPVTTQDSTLMTSFDDGIMSN